MAQSRVYLGSDFLAVLNSPETATHFLLNTLLHAIYLEISVDISDTAFMGLAYYACALLHAWAILDDGKDRWHQISHCSSFACGEKWRGEAALDLIVNSLYSPPKVVFIKLVSEISHSFSRQPRIYFPFVRIATRICLQGNQPRRHDLYRCARDGLSRYYHSEESARQTIGSGKCHAHLQTHCWYRSCHDRDGW